MDVFASGRIAIDQIAVVGVPVAQQVRDEILSRALEPVVDVEIGRALKAIGEQRPGEGFHVCIEPHNVVAIALRRTAVHQQHGFQIFFERVDSQPEEVRVKLVDRAPTRRDVVLVGCAHEQFVDEIILGCRDAHSPPFIPNRPTWIRPLIYLVRDVAPFKSKSDRARKGRGRDFADSE
ncbi:hypothetical protein AL00_12690 [Sphingobium indicum F2]|uniref:Uncharacterized protein n=1 Tax=Sphingobium indicum F2 TaxID=1450518 RepID=A0A8E0WRK4_9SPHN|nr:hypothetical protein AL00_12690 [Sphingobium indicum F2]